MKQLRDAQSNVFARWQAVIAGCFHARGMHSACEVIAVCLKKHTGEDFVAKRMAQNITDFLCEWLGQCVGYDFVEVMQMEGGHRKTKGVDDMGDQLSIQGRGWSKLPGAEVNTRPTSVDVKTYSRVAYSTMILIPTIAAQFEGIVTGVLSKSVVCSKPRQLDVGASCVSLSHTGLSSCRVC